MHFRRRKTLPRNVDQYSVPQIDRVVHRKVRHGVADSREYTRKSVPRPRQDEHDCHSGKAHPLRQPRVPPHEWIHVPRVGVRTPQVPILKMARQHSPSRSVSGHVSAGWPADKFLVPPESTGAPRVSYAPRRPPSSRCDRLDTVASSSASGVPIEIANRPTRRETPAVWQRDVSPSCHVGPIFRRPPHNHVPAQAFIETVRLRSAASIARPCSSVSIGVTSRLAPPLPCCRSLPFDGTAAATHTVLNSRALRFICSPTFQQAPAANAGPPPVCGETFRTKSCLAPKAPVPARSRSRERKNCPASTFQGSSPETTPSGANRDTAIFRLQTVLVSSPTPQRFHTRDRSLPIDAQGQHRVSFFATERLTVTHCVTQFFKARVLMAARQKHLAALRKSRASPTHPGLSSNNSRRA